MKKNKLKGYFLAAGILLASGGIILSTTHDVASVYAGEQIIDVDPTHDHSTKWYDLDINPNDHEDEGTAPYGFELLLSPLPGDYRGFSPSSISKLLKESMDGIKDIVSAQVNFMHPTEDEPFKAGEDFSFNSKEEKRQDVITQLVKGTLKKGDGSEEVIPENVDDFLTTIRNGYVGLDQTVGSFLKEMVIYTAAYGSAEDDAKNRGGVTDATKVSSRLGMNISGSTVTYGDASVYHEFVDIFTKCPIAVEGASTAEEKAASVMNTLYQESVKVAVDNKLKTESVVKIFDGLESTIIPVKTIINILGPQNVLDSVKKIFTDDSVESVYGIHFLNSLSKRSISDICDYIQMELAETGGGFTKDDIMEAFQDSNNEKLFEIFDGLGVQGIYNISIILGKPVDFAPEDGNYHPTDRDPYDPIPTPTRHITRGHSGQASGSQYAKFGTKLVNEVMKRLSVDDLLTAVNKVDLTYKDVKYTVLEKPVDEIDNNKNNLELRLHNVVDLLHIIYNEVKQIPTFDDSHKKYLEFDMDLYTVINDVEIISDTEMQVIPVKANIKLGFQDKDLKYIKKFIKLVDQGIDFDFGFTTEESDPENPDNLWATLNVRAPKVFSEIYKFIFDSGFIKNTEDEKVLNDLWNLLFSSIDEIKEYIQSKTVADLVSYLSSKHIDYEMAINTITSADLLNEILCLSEFGIREVTQADINKVIDVFARVVRKGATLSYDDVLDMIKSINAGIASKLDNDSLRNLFDKVHSILEKIAGKDISVEFLQGITNEQIDGYIQKITGKEDLLLRLRTKLIKIINKIPADLRAKSLMDFYVGQEGNGSTFHGNQKIEMTDDRYSKVINALPKGDKIWVIFDGMIVGHDRPKSFELTVDAHIQDIYRVDFSWEEAAPTKSMKKSAPATVTKTKSGMLHIGSDIRLFAGIDEDANGKIAHWLDASKAFERVDYMPEYPVSLIPEYEYEVTISDDINKTYDGTGELSVEVVGQYKDYYSLTYVWERKNASGEFEAISGETNSSISVPNVLDSGTYRCEVTAKASDDDPGIVVVSPEAEVNIVKQGVDITPIEFMFEHLGYTGEERENLIDLTTITGDLTSTLKKDSSGNYVITYSGNKQTEIGGPYHASAKFELADTDNYEFTHGDTVTKDWYIDEKITLEWSSTNEFKRDGEFHNNVLTPQSLEEASEYIESVTYETKKVSETTFVAGGQKEIGHYVTNAVVTLKNPDVDYDKITVPEPEEFLIYDELDIGELSWSSHTTFKYDGNSHSVYVRYLENYADVLAGVKYTTVGNVEASAETNVETNADQYVTVAEPIYQDGFDAEIIRFTNNSVFGEAKARHWVISPEVLDVKHICWDYETPFVYDGTAHTVDVLDGCLPEQVTYSVNTGTGLKNSAVNAGTYTASVTIAIKDEYAQNYVFSDDSVLTYNLVWSIHPQAITFTNSDFVWKDASQDFAYTGSEIENVIEGLPAYQDIISVSYVNNAGVNAGNYESAVILTIIDDAEGLNRNNYYLVNDVFVHNWEIAKQQISVSPVEWNYNSTTTYVEDGNEKEVHVISYANSTYVDCVVVDEGYVSKATEAGEYQAKVEFIIKEVYAGNYELVGKTSDIIDWKIHEATPESYKIFESSERVDGDYNARVELETPIYNNPTLHAVLSNGDEFKDADIDFKALVGGRGEVSYSYSLSFSLNDQAYDIGENEFTTCILVPEDIRGLDYKVVVMDENGNVSEVQVETVLEGKYAVIHGDFVEKVGFVTKKNADGTISENPSSLAFILLAGAGQLIFVILTIIFTKKFKKSRE